jgi:hypothetical protein
MARAAQLRANWQQIFQACQGFSPSFLARLARLDLDTIDGAALSNVLPVGNRNGAINLAVDLGSAEQPFDGRITGR